MRNEGYVVGRRPGTGTLGLDPSLTLTMDDLRGVLTTFKRLLAQGENGIE